MHKKTLWLLGMIFWLLWYAPGFLAQGGPHENESASVQGEARRELFQTSESDRPAEPFVWLGLVVLGIGLLVVKHAYKRVTQQGVLSQAALQTLQQERQRLLQELARLDELHEMDKITEQRYAFERQHRHQQLMEVSFLCKASS